MADVNPLVVIRRWSQLKTVELDRQEAELAAEMLSAKLVWGSRQLPEVPVSGRIALHPLP